MEKILKEKTENSTSSKEVVHTMLIYVYVIFFLSIVLGVLFDLIFKLNLLADFEYSHFGFILIIFGTLLIFLAQQASSRASKISKEEESVEGFMYGPYKHFRHPTYLGVFFMVLGFGIAIKSIFSILFIMITYLIVKLTFVRREENILEKKYGKIYLDYKNRVRM